MDRREQTILQSFSSAFRGLRHMLRERNFVIQVALGLLALILVFVFKLTWIELIVIILLIGFVLSLETINSAGEKVLDLITREHHPEVAVIKEILAGSVLIASITALVIGMLIFIGAILK